MSLVDILEPVLSGGIRNTNFFNGRILAAEDLTDFQTANARQHQQLARAIGDGVAYGLQVRVTSSSATQSVLHVTQGLALNRKGQAVALPADVDLALVPQAEVEDAEAGLFAVCQPPQIPILTNPGLYVLTLMPASQLSKESAPKTEVFDDGAATTCGSRYVDEGAKFRTVALDLGTSPDPNSLAGQALNLATQLDLLRTQLAKTSGAAADNLRAQIAPRMSRFRNCAAHLCFGTEQFANFPANPFGRSNGSSLFDEYGAIDHLHDLAKLTDCEVPLALLYWTNTGLQFVDMWSVRRPVFPPTASDAWAPLAGRRRAVEGLAMFLQFQCHLAGLLTAIKSASALASVVAADYFAYLPATGFIPVGGAKSSIGLDYQRFFQGHTYRDPVFIEGAKLETLVHTSLLLPPINLGSGEMFWLYRLRENMQAVAGATINLPQPCLIFANGHIRYEGNAQYDLNYWDYANYA
ncbi:MAG: hypothetical protein LAN64_15120 [Acidobacteriia bacterium]|nr:hypothetical protein [Terriglobia bacterium]